MKFMLTFSAKPDKVKRDEAIARFTQTGGCPPNGVKLLGRWTRADFSKGYDLLESDDPKSLAEFALAWNDLLEVEIAPVMEDQEVAAALATVRK